MSFFLKQYKTIQNKKYKILITTQEMLIDPTTLGITKQRRRAEEQFGILVTKKLRFSERASPVLTVFSMNLEARSRNKTTTPYLQKIMH